MKKRYFHLSPKLTLALSATLLVLALGYLWTALGYPMPTKGLALRKAELREALPRGEVVAELDLRRELEQEGENALSLYWGEYCLFTRQGERPYIAYMDRTAGFLWGPTFFTPVLPETPPIDLGSLQHWGVQDGSPYSDGQTRLTATVLPDGIAAARVTVTQTNTPSDVLRAGNETAYVEEHGVTTEASELTPGSGVWISKQRIPQPPQGKYGYTHSAVARVYDSAGTLLCTIGP